MFKKYFLIMIFSITFLYSSQTNVQSVEDQYQKEAKALEKLKKWEAKGYDMSSYYDKFKLIDVYKEKQKEEVVNIAGIIGYYSIPFLFVSFILFAIFKTIFKKKKTLEQIEEEAKQKEIKSFNRAKSQWRFIKNYYKHVYFVGLLLIVLFPPHYNGSRRINYDFILGGSSPIHFSTFTAIMLGYAAIGISFYFLFIKKKQ